MAIVYTWNIVQMDAYPEKDGLTDVVFRTNWTVSGTDGTYTGDAYGTASVTLNNEGVFTPYNKLTQQQVIGWVKNSLGEEVAVIEARIATQIANQASPPVVTLPLPWLLNTN